MCRITYAWAFYGWLYAVCVCNFGLRQIGQALIRGLDSMCARKISDTRVFSATHSTADLNRLYKTIHNHNCVCKQCNDVKKNRVIFDCVIGGLLWSKLVSGRF